MLKQRSNRIKFFGIGFILILIQLLSSNYSLLNAQPSIDEIKASLIIQFCDNVNWTRNISNEYIIGCYCDDESVFNVLESATKKVKIQGKNFRVKLIKSTEAVALCDVIYYKKSDKKDLVPVFNIIREKNILLITDNYTDQLFVLINMIDDGKKVSFKVNMPNLTLAGFTLKPNLLLNGGSVVDIKAAYEKFEAQLNESRELLDKTKLELANSEKKLHQKDLAIKQKESEIEKFVFEIEKNKKASDELIKQVEQEQELLKQKTAELGNQKIQLQNIQLGITQKQQELSQIRMKVLSLKNESDALKTAIGQKNITLSQQEHALSHQKILLIFSLALIAALFIAAFSVARLFLIKKRHNKELEDKVNIRTQELKIKSEQYLSLFNLAPVAIWEADFSEVKKFIDSKDFKDEQEFDKYANSNSDFSIECVRRIRFININNAALEMYKINDSKEIFELYEEAHAKGKLGSLVNEFKLVYLNVKTHSFEANRLNKQKEQLDVLTNWIDVSDKPGTFSRVLLTLVDVTLIRKIESELRRHKENLELLVKERTDEISALNEELRSQNEELLTTNEALEDVNKEIKHANEELNLQKRKLDDALNDLQNAQLQMIQSEKMASLGILTAGVAHEINNPLNFIQTGLYALESTLNKDKVPAGIMGKVTRIMGNMYVGIQRASAIVKSLNTFSRKDTNLIKEFDIHQVIDNSLLILNHELKNKCVVNKEFTNEAFILKGNEENLHQVFINIFMNAVQAIDSEGLISISTKLTDNQKLEIVISDNGKGISQDDLKKIFDPFFTTKEAGQGVGLGLSIVYKIIDEHKGTIKYSSELNKGTSIIIHLPVKKN
jgi:signal transduction histidine kinase